MLQQKAINERECYHLQRQ